MVWRNCNSLYLLYGRSYFCIVNVKKRVSSVCVENDFFSSFRKIVNTEVRLIIFGVTYFKRYWEISITRIPQSFFYRTIFIDDDWWVIICSDPGWVFGVINVTSQNQSHSSLLGTIKCKTDTCLLNQTADLSWVIWKLSGIIWPLLLFRQGVAPSYYSLISCTNLFILFYFSFSGTRNVVAECLGKLTLIDPSNLLPRLQESLKSNSALMRTTVLTAVKFTISDQVRL